MLPATDCIENSILEQIKKGIRPHRGKPIKEIKDTFPEYITYEMIRIALVDLQVKKQA